ncbi:hemin uptake protein HemP [Pseudotabrizicola formosa]|uniref:hemin uptake protein HemP n=1 Tax=Pseudotabrizicola formosa TaxID=2030009 RepID=UPI003F490CB6
MHHATHAAPPCSELSARPCRSPAHEAMALTKGGPVAHIILEGQVYTLRITRAGKLILTK